MRIEEEECSSITCSSASSFHLHSLISATVAVVVLFLRWPYSVIETALSETCTAGSPAVYTKNNSRTKCQADLIVANAERTHRARITLSREEERVVQRGKAEWNPVLQGKRSSPSHLQRGCLFRSPYPLSLSPPRVALGYCVYCPGEVVRARIERDS